MQPAPTPAQLARRAELLSHCGPSDAEELADLTDQLGRVMQAEELVVRRLTIDEPPDTLDRLVAEEPVHPFAGPDDLADRLDVDRRCFVLEHPALPGRPLNVVWCALRAGVPGRLVEILDADAPPFDPALADTAAFYSIWNVEPGLVGLPGGHRLLQGAIGALRSEFGALSTFVTLSPIPGFRAWLEARGDVPADPHRRLVECARYLTALRDDGRPIDAVARFHLGNGARLLSLARDGDPSDRGDARSFGIMANYRYEPEDRAANRAALHDGRPAVGAEVATLLG